MSRAQAVLAAALMAALAMPRADAFVRSLWTPDGSEPGVRWDLSLQSPAAYFDDDGRVLYRFITNGVYAMPSADYMQAVRHAFRTWEDETNAVIRFAEGPAITNDVGAAAEEDFSVGFTDAGGITQYGTDINGFLALASWTYYVTTPRRFADADIAFNRNASFSTDGSGGTDVENTALHEAGHTLGLSHSPDSQSEMSYMGGWFGTGSGNTAGRRLASDDRLAVAVIYPTADFTAGAGSVKGSITLGGAPVQGAQVGLYTTNDILVATTIARLGVYRFDGVHAGTYTVRAFPSITSGEYLHQSWSSISSSIRGSPEVAPTAFVASASQDVSGIVVSAGGTVTANVAVVSGSMAMKLVYATRRVGATTQGRTQVLRVARGASYRLGVAGTSIPTDSSQLGGLAIGGPGVTVSGVTFGSFSGYSHISFDVAVAADAALGARPLSLLSTNYPGHRQLVFGFVEVYDPASLTLGPGPAPPAAREVAVGVTNVPVLQFTLQPGAGDRARLRKFALAHTGSGDVADVTAVRLYVDADGDGLAGPSDTLLASNRFAGATATLEVVDTIDAGTGTALLACYDFGGGVQPGDAFAASVAPGGIDAWGWQSSTAIGVGGGAVTGGTVTVDATPPSGGAVRDGAGEDVDRQVSTNTIAANWSGFTDDVSGIAGYRWAIGTVPGGTNLQPFTAVGGAAAATNGALALADYTRCFVTVRAVDGAGNVSGDVVSDGVLVFADADGDGVLDAAEERYGTDSTNALDIPGPGPAWWFNRAAIEAGAAANDYAAAVQGQVKWLATQAAREMDALLDGGAGTGVSNLLARFTAASNYCPVAVGQVKTAAAPFYERLGTPGPWGGTAQTNDCAAANIGQVKNAFSFAVP